MATEYEFNEDVKGLTLLHGDPPFLTNAHMNRETAERIAVAATKAGLDMVEIVSTISKEFPRVFYQDAEGIIGQKYDSYYAVTDNAGMFALKETKYTITSKAADALIQRVKKRKKLESV